MESSLIDAYLEKIHAKDPITSNHCGKAAEYALRLGRKLELSEDQLIELGYAAILHDVGKLMVPDDILLKPASLTVEEYAVMQCHPAWGAEIVESFEDHPRRQRVAQIVRCHHERYDGTGYPEGIPSEGIPFLAQIVAIADAFDAMTSDRPYRSAMSGEQAQEILLQERGKQFHPHLVDHFVEELNINRVN